MDGAALTGSASTRIWNNCMVCTIDPRSTESNTREHAHCTIYTAVCLGSVSAGWLAEWHPCSERRPAVR